MQYYGICPASCGEYVQGQVESGEFLSSYCVSLFSKAVIKNRDGHTDKLASYPKAIKAMKKTFEYFDEKKALGNVCLEMISNIPRSKGMASSSADIGAVIGASSAYLGINITPKQASKIAAEIEPTDSIFHKNIVAMNPLTGQLIEDIGIIEGIKTLILEPHTRVKTKDVRKQDNYLNYKLTHLDTYKSILFEFQQAVRTNDLKSLGQVVNKSAILNDNLLPKPYLKDVMEIAMTLGAYGVNIAHSGSAIGILLDVNDSAKIYKEEIIKQNLSKYFGRMYCLPVIDGGINYGRMS